MKTSEAIAICERWFAHLEAQAEKSVKLQRAAAMARAGDMEGARKLKRQVDATPRVFDGATLEPAVRHLVKVCRNA